MFGLPTEVHYCSARTNIFRSIAHNIPSVRYSGCKGQNRSSSRGTGRGLWGTVAAEQPQSTACTSGVFVFPAPAGGGGQVPEATT
jgi:hypothetical protein